MNSKERTRISFILFLFIPSLLANCVGLQKPGKTDYIAEAYLKDRVLDAGDTVDLSLGVKSYGFKVMVGPLQTGFYWSLGGEIGLKQGNLGTTEVGELAILSFILEDSEPYRGTAKYYDREKKAHNRLWGGGRYHPSYYTRFGIVLGAFTSFRISINPGEILDLILGFLTVDLYKDDVFMPGYSKYQKYKKSEKEYRKQNREMIEKEKKIEEMRKSFWAEAKRSAEVEKWIRGKMSTYIKGDLTLNPNITALLNKNDPYYHSYSGLIFRKYSEYPSLVIAAILGKWNIIRGLLKKPRHDKKNQKWDEFTYSYLMIKKQRFPDDIIKKLVVRGLSKYIISYGLRERMERGYPISKNLFLFLIRYGAKVKFATCTTKSQINDGQVKKTNTDKCF
ncbi:MAG: hypothetical protein AAF518_00005 [Spirochaetota bacterium]